MGWGHSSLRQALDFAEVARVRHLVGFHHDPGHTDAIIDRIFDEARAGCPFLLTPGREGASFKLGADT